MDNKWELSFIYAQIINFKAEEAAGEGRVISIKKVIDEESHFYPPWQGFLNHFELLPFFFFPFWNRMKYIKKITQQLIAV